MEARQSTESGSSPDQPVGLEKAAWTPNLAGLGRLLGFIMLAAPAAAVLTGLVLVPQYAQLQRLKHQRDCLAAQAKEAQSVVVGYDRLIAAAREDETQVKRLAMSQLGMQPRNEIVVLDRGLAPAPPPTLVLPETQAMPPEPDDWIMRLEPKMTSPRIKLGLGLMAVGCLMGAVFIFGLPGGGPKRPAIEEIIKESEKMNSVESPAGSEPIDISRGK